MVSNETHGKAEIMKKKLNLDVYKTWKYSGL